MGETEVVAFLSSLALNSHVAASTQNQALSALVFMYAQVLGVELDWLQGLVRAKRPERLPVVLTQAEVRCRAASCAFDTSVCWRIAPVERH